MMINPWFSTVCTEPEQSMSGYTLPILELYEELLVEAGPCEVLHII